MIADVIEKLTLLMQGKLPAKIDCSQIGGDRDRNFAQLFNQLIACMEEVHHFIFPLARGELGDIKFSPKNFLASPFKELHSRLRHLTWQAKQVANGDYSQRVDFMGDFSEAFNFMIIELERKEKLLKEKIDELQQAIGHIKKLEGVLPICSYCKRIRQQSGQPQDQQNWIKLEDYLSSRTNAQFTHSICPECLEKYYPEYAEP